MARVECEVEEIMLPGDHTDIPSVAVECTRCGLREESYGTDERSVKRCLALLRENCTQGERNFYVVEED